MAGLEGVDIIRQAVHEVLRDLHTDPKAPQDIKDKMNMVDPETIVDRVVNQTSLSDVLNAVITAVIALDVESFILGMTLGMEVKPIVVVPTGTPTKKTT